MVSERRRTPRRGPGPVPPAPRASGPEVDGPNAPAPMEPPVKVLLWVICACLAALAVAWTIAHVRALV